MTGSGILLAADFSFTNSITNFGAISGDLVGINVNGGGALSNGVGAFCVTRDQYVVSQDHMVSDPSVMSEVRTYHE